ncbi:MAG: ImmA/IrrE family metallo-endopeptidase [Halanaerobiales bacterium]|nr:ImmA/IrrE family metallo-endopeptidase [Halanaerobiales bacterium]
MKKQSVNLSEVEIEEIYKLAEKKRRELGFVGETPIANDIFTILDNLNIYLLEYPIKIDGEKPAFSAALLYSAQDDKELVFIGLNTSHYFDRQIFAIAHELYHYFTKTGSHLSRLSEDNGNDNITEVKANLFAAEFLLPEKILKSIIINEFKTSSLESIKINTLLRFIARLQCTWWLPYRSLVKRLKEISVISKKQFSLLYEIEERNNKANYWRLGMAINKEIFSKLNSHSKNIGTSPSNIENIIRNFEDELIDEDTFYDVLTLFNKTPEDFGFEIEVDSETINEFNSFFNEEDDYED